MDKIVKQRERTKLWKHKNRDKVLEYHKKYNAIYDTNKKKYGKCNICGGREYANLEQHLKSKKHLKNINN